MPLPDATQPMTCRHCGGDVEYIVYFNRAVYQCHGCGRCSMDYGNGVLLTSDIIQPAEQRGRGKSGSEPKGLRNPQPASE